MMAFWLLALAVQEDRLRRLLPTLCWFTIDVVDEQTEEGKHDGEKEPPPPPPIATELLLPPLRPFFGCGEIEDHEDGKCVACRPASC